jgi:hypothetical protein
MNIDQLEDIAGRAGMYTDLMRTGAASLVYSPGCKGVRLDELERFAALVAEAAARRCVELCRARIKTTSDGYPAYSEDDAMQSCADAIAREFGLEGK